MRPWPSLGIDMGMIYLELPKKWKSTACALAAVTVRGPFARSKTPQQRSSVRRLLAHGKKRPGAHAHRTLLVESVS